MGIFPPLTLVFTLTPYLEGNMAPSPTPTPFPPRPRRQPLRPQPFCEMPPLPLLPILQPSRLLLLHHDPTISPLATPLTARPPPGTIPPRLDNPQRCAQPGR